MVAFRADRAVRRGASSHDQAKKPTMSNPNHHHHSYRFYTTNPKIQQCQSQTATIRTYPQNSTKKPHRTDAMRPIMCLFISVGIYPMVAAAGKSGFNYYKMSMPNHQAQPSRWCLSYLYKPILNLFPATCLVFLGYPFSVR